MSDAASWERPYLVPGGADALLYYAVFGRFDWGVPLSNQRYRSDGVPAGFELMAYDREVSPEVFAMFQQGYPWTSLQRDQPELAAAVASSPTCVVLRGSRPDPTTLDYLRQTVGLVTYLLDQGGTAVYDPQILNWWQPAEWRERVFEPAAPVPMQHVVILVSDLPEGEGVWVHTRGLRKFGRPDLSVRGVGPHHVPGVVALFERFVEFQVLGAVVTEGQAVSVPFLPDGGVARHAGTPDDPDFNNVHLEIEWPPGSLT